MIKSKSLRAVVDIWPKATITVEQALNNCAREMVNLDAVMQTFIANTIEATKAFKKFAREYKRVQRLVHKKENK